MLRFFCGEVYPLAVNPEFTVLLDVYGNVLTEKERAMLDYYYNDDLSLREISDNENAERRARRNSGEQPPRENDTITRQGVRDTIKRAEAKLLSMEEKLGLVRRNRELLQLTADIRKNAEKAAVRAYQARAPKEIITAASDIDTLAEKIEELLR
ncbi:MAG: DNA-binding protein [Clostridia bacterium]|jgi:predicted DNA-binding protein YlxM (UPF0122 family)|nr:DNA-binding protein [Clostridia bacterium]